MTKPAAMREPSYSTAFKKDRKLMHKRGKDMTKLQNVIFDIINEIPLPPKYREHPLHNNWEGCLECHIEPDWLLVYIIDDDAPIKTVDFKRMGTHTDLF
jgi:mRNA interferase YafQ